MNNNNSKFNMMMISKDYWVDQRKGERENEGKMNNFQNVQYFHLHGKRIMLIILDKIQREKSSVHDIVNISSSWRIGSGWEK